MAVKFAEFSGGCERPGSSRTQGGDIPVVVFESGDRGVVRTGNRVEGFAGPDSMMENRVRRNGLRSKVFGVAGMTACHLRFAFARGDGQSDGKVNGQHFSSCQAIAFQVVPSANHLFRDAEIFRHRRDRVAFAHLVASRGMRVRACIGLFPRRDWDDQTRFRSESVVT